VSGNRERGGGGGALASLNSEHGNVISVPGGSLYGSASLVLCIVPATCIMTVSRRAEECGVGEHCPICECVICG